MTVWRMRIVCWIPKATDTHSEHVIVIAFQPQQWLQERAAVLDVHCLSCPCCSEGPAPPRKEQIKRKSELANLWDACANGTWEDFLGKWHSLLSQLFFIFFARPVSLCCEEHVYLSTYLTAYRLCKNYHCCQIILQLNIFTQIGRGERRFDWIFITGVPA